MRGVFRRCGCRTPDGKQYGVLPEGATPAQKQRACPLMVSNSKHGRWSYRLSAGTDPVTGNRRQVNGGSFATKREARAARARHELDIVEGKLVEPSAERLGAYLDRWIERRSRIGPRGGEPLAEATLENYKRYIEKEIRPSRLGAMKLRDVRRAHVQRFVDDLLAAGRGAVTIRRIVATLQSALTAAVTEELIGASPAHDLELPAAKPRKVTPWEPEQVAHFLHVAQGHRLGALFEVAIFTGLRRAELCGLQWSEIDLPARQLTVRRDTTKTDAGQRRIALDDRTVAALQSWHAFQLHERELFQEAWTDSGFVFTMEDGRPVKKAYATRTFQKLRTEAGLPYMTFHGQRHQQASLQLAAGVPLAVVSKRLGHSSIAVTADVYSHLMDSTEHAAANAAAALVPKPQG